VPLAVPRPRPRRSTSRVAVIAAATALIVLLTAAPASGAVRAPGAQEPAATTAAPWDPNGVALQLQKIPGSFNQPVLVTNAGDGSGRLFVVEQGGLIKVIRNGVVQAAPFLDFRPTISTGGERGLLGLAFHPSFKTNGKFYVNFTNTSGNTAINEYRVTTHPDRVDWRTGRRLMTIEQPYANHNGGHLAFGPDGYLYIGMGDGGGTGDPGNRAQNLGTLLGKMLRIDVNGSTAGLPYGIPSTNPYRGRPGLDQIWASGLRNPWRFSFDRRWGVLWIADVGQSRYEEVNRATPWDDAGGRGHNYGWRVLEGRHCYIPSSGCSTTGKRMPFIEYAQTVAGEDNCSVTGGYAYRGVAYPALYGAYLFGDLCSGRIWGVWVSAASPATPKELLNTNLTISSFGEGEDGTVYVVDYNGAIYRIVGHAR